MILKEYHGNRYLDVSTQSKLEDVCFSIVKGRYGNTENTSYNLSYIKDEIESVNKNKPFISLDEANKWPESLLKKEVIESWKTYERILKEVRKNQIIYNNIVECLKSNNKKLAVNIVESQEYWSNHEFEIIDVEKEYK